MQLDHFLGDLATITRDSVLATLLHWYHLGSCCYDTVSPLWWWILYRAINRVFFSESFFSVLSPFSLEFNYRYLFSLSVSLSFLFFSLLSSFPLSYPTSRVTKKAAHQNLCLLCKEHNNSKLIFDSSKKFEIIQKLPSNIYGRFKQFTHCRCG